MQQPNAHPRDLAGELDHQLRRQERQLVVVRLVVVALALAFLVVFGEPIEGRVPIMLLLVAVAGYSVLIGLASRRLPIRPVAALGVTLDAIAVAGVVRLATNVPDSYLFFGVVILGVAVRFGMVASVAASAAISAAYLAIVVATPALDDFTGEWLPVRILFLVIFGVVAGMFSALVSRHAAENVLLQQRLEAEQRERDLAEDQIAREQHAQRVKDDFLSVVSHELRTPLTSIQGYSQLLESRLRAAGSGGRELGHVRVILSQVARMRRLVDDLLDVNRMDRRGGVSIEPVEFDLSDLLREAVGRTARAAPDRVINLEVPPSIAVRLDRERIDQVVGNLLENALKYSPEGGPVRVVALDDAGEVEVRVTDCGIGVPPDQREDVFERFYQADDDQGGRRFGGLGLGLAISRAIVEAHGGRIWVTDNVDAGRGSVFAFRVPREVATPPSSADDGDVPPFVTRGSVS